MNKIMPMIAVLLLFSLQLPLLAGAVSYPVTEERNEEKAATPVMHVGSKICLFQSGTTDVKAAIHVQDTLIVYRELPSHELKEVGKIRVVSFIREDFLKAEVIEGELMPGDIAKKGDVASLVISSDDKCK
jgi:hypothetical protein